jgi:hypothetical protein
MRIVNVFVRPLLWLPVRTPLSRQLMLVSITGRKTGRHYKQPVSYVRDGDTLLTPGGGTWKLNLREGQPISIRLGGRDITALPELVRDPGEVQRLLGKILVANPRASSFMPFVGPDGRVDDQRLTTAIEHGFSIVRWHLGAGAGGGSQ